MSQWWKVRVKHQKSTSHRYTLECILTLMVSGVWVITCILPCGQLCTVTHVPTWWIICPHAHPPLTCFSTSWLFSSAHILTWCFLNIEPHHLKVHRTGCQQEIICFGLLTIIPGPRNGVCDASQSWESWETPMHYYRWLITGPSCPHVPTLVFWKHLNLFYCYWSGVLPSVCIVRLGRNKYFKAFDTNAWLFYSIFQVVRPYKLKFHWVLSPVPPETCKNYQLRKER